MKRTFHLFATRMLKNGLKQQYDCLVSVDGSAGLAQLYEELKEAVTNIFNQDPVIMQGAQPATPVVIESLSELRDSPPAPLVDTRNPSPSLGDVDLSGLAKKLAGNGAPS